MQFKISRLKTTFLEQTGVTLGENLDFENALKYGLLIRNSYSCYLVFNISIFIYILQNQIFVIYLTSNEDGYFWPLNNNTITNNLLLN